MSQKIDINELSLEEGFEKIEELINEMSDADVSLEESFNKYKLGMDLVKHCGEQIERVEKQIIQLSNDN